MPEFSSRPDGLPIHASTGNPASNIKPSRNNLFRYTGYAVNTIISSDDHNGKFQANGFWFGYLDQNGVRNSDWLDTTIIRQLSLDSLTYPIGTNPTIFPGPEPLTRTSLLFNGVRVETDNELLQTAIANTSTFGDPLYSVNAIKPGRIWIYLKVPADPDGVSGVRIIGGPAGLPDAPEAEEQALVGVDIDAAGLITGHTAPTAQPLVYELPIAIPVFFDQVSIQDLTVLGTLGVVGAATLDSTLDVEGSTKLGLLPTDTHDFIGVADIFGSLTVGGGLAIPLVITDTPAGKTGLSLTGAGDITAATIDGGGHTAVTATNTSAQPTAIMVNLGAGRATFVQNNDASSCAQRVENIGGGCAQQITGVGTATTLEVEQTGTGSGASITNDDPASPALVVVNNDVAGIGLTVTGSVSGSLGSTFGTGASGLHTLNGDVTLGFDDTNLTTSVGPIASIEHRYIDTTVLPSVDGGSRMRNGDLIMRREGQTLAVYIPTQGFLTTYTSVANGYSTVLQATRALDADQPVIVEVKMWAYRIGGAVTTMDWRVRSSLIVANVFQDGTSLGNGAANKKVIYSKFPFTPSVLEGALSGMGTHVFDLDIDRNDVAEDVTALEIWLTISSGVQL